MVHAGKVHPMTVKRIDIFGNIEDTFQTEQELNGWRERQQALFDRDGWRTPDGRSPACHCDDGDGAEHDPECPDLQPRML